jgi:putative transposase
VRGDNARRFLAQGMVGLIDQRTTHSGRKGHHFPDPVASYMLYLRQWYPPIRFREIVRIVERRFGYHTNHHTVKRFLDTHPIPVQLPLTWTIYHEFEDAYRARWTVVRMHYEGWQVQSIAGCLKLSERHVRRILAAFERDGFAGLEDKRQRPTDHPANQLTLPLMQDILGIQRAHPRAGKFRVRGLLGKQKKTRTLPSTATIGRAMARNRALHNAPPPWRSDKQPQNADGEVKQMRYHPEYRHQYWFIDVRYLRKLDGAWVYSICILEGYSRKMLAGMVSEYQDEIAILQILAAAVSDYGCPTGIVSDNGKVFTAQAYCTVLNALGITPHYIDKGKAWQNLIEAQFKVQVRLSQAAFDDTKTFEAIQAAHATFIEEFNTTEHAAHQQRPVTERTPVAVLNWVRGRIVEPEQVQAILRHVQYERAVNQHGYISIQRYYIYAERGLARQRVSVWLYEGRLHIEYQHTMLARYTASYNRKEKRLQRVRQPELRKTQYADPQLEFWELDDHQWQKVVERTIRPRTTSTRQSPGAEQLSLHIAGLLLLLLVTGTPLR